MVSGDGFALSMKNSWICRSDGEYINKHADGFPSRPARPCFLIIRLERAGNVVMHDKTNVWFVYPHPKCVGRDHYVGLSGHKRLLHTSPGIHFHATVVDNNLALRWLTDRLGDLFTPFARRRINDTTAGVLRRYSRRASSFSRNVVCVATT